MIPSPWTPAWPYNEIAAHQTAIGPTGGTLVTTNNDAHYVPVIFPENATLTEIRFVANNGTGNYDVGLYDGTTLARLVSSGSTAMSAAGLKTLSTALSVVGGKVYLAALALSSTTSEVFRSNYAAGAAAAFENAGWGHEASALPLPATATPVTTVSYTVIPCFSYVFS